MERQKPIAVTYEGHRLEVGFRADLVVEGEVLVELKSVEAITPLFKKITLNYLKLVPLRLGYLINFNEVHLKEGITRIVNGAEGKAYFSREGREGREGNECKTPALNPASSRPSLPRLCALRETRRLSEVNPAFCPGQEAAGSESVSSPSSLITGAMACNLSPLARSINLTP